MKQNQAEADCAGQENIKRCTQTAHVHLLTNCGSSNLSFQLPVTRGGLRIQSKAKGVETDTVDAKSNADSDPMSAIDFGPGSNLPWASGGDPRIRKTQRWRRKSNSGLSEKCMCSDHRSTSSCLKHGHHPYLHIDAPAPSCALLLYTPAAQSV